MADKSSSPISNLHEICIFAVDLALQAGQTIIKERRMADYKTSYKDQHELVTSTDIKVDEMICERIRTIYPDHRILSEEGANDLERLQQESTTPLWVIDPIDGTVNYAYGHNQVAVSIAYFEDNIAKVGVVHAPLQKETFQAIRNQYAMLNHKPIQVSGQTTMRQALIATGFPYHKDTVEHLVNRLQAVLSECRDIRRIGSAALDICWVATGRLDAYYETVSPWDFAAAQLIAREAGARFGHLGEVPDNQPAELYGKDIVVASPELFDPLCRILNDADSRR